MIYTPRYYQSESAEKTLQHFYNSKGKTNPLIALPTGTGKSLVIVLFILRMLQDYWQLRVIVVTHSKDLVYQNHKRFASMAPHIPAGINCDGLDKRDIFQPVIFGSIQSMFSMMGELGSRDVIIIDEAHKATEDKTSVYFKFIDHFKTINPNCILVGLTATPYDNYGEIIRRNEKGEIVSLFDSFSYYKIKPDDFKEFVENGWLARLITKSTDTKYDVSQVKIQQGKFNQKQLQEATDQEVLTTRVVRESIYIADLDNRHCGLVFCNGIEHSEHMAEEFIAQGETAVWVHSKRSKSQNKIAMEEFHSGEARWMTNNGVLTTGYDHPPIDIGVFARHTTSVPLLHQMLGRLTRPYDYNNPGDVNPTAFPYVKRNGLVLDFACNIERLGPIDAPYFKKPKTGEPGDAPVKICPSCKVYNYASARNCQECGYEFDFAVKYEGTSGYESPMSLAEAEEKREWKNVSYVNYQRIGGINGKPNMLQVVYHYGSKTVSEIVCLEHKNGAFRHAISWWNAHTDNCPVPDSVERALSLTHLIKQPIKIEISTTPGVKYPKVTNYVYQ